jgi:hypothetical protein
LTSGARWTDDRPKPSPPLGLFFALFSPRPGIGLKSFDTMFDTFGEIRL